MMFGLEKRRSTAIDYVTTVTDYISGRSKNIATTFAYITGAIPNADIKWIYQEINFFLHVTKSVHMLWLMG